MAPRLLTIFPRLRHVALHKDPGLIPYHFVTDVGWESELAFCQVEPGTFSGGEAFDSTVTLSPLAFTDSRPERIVRFTSFLLSRAHRYDALLLYQLGLDSLLYAWIYKKLNPGGVTFLKLDMDRPNADMLLNAPDSPKRRLNFAWLRAAPVDFYTVETVKIFERVEPFFADHGRTLHLVPNGFSPAREVDIDEVLGRKERLIVTVGRLGTPQKHTELLLDALELLPESALEGWRFLFVGSTTPELDARFDELVTRRPELAARLERTGHITDRDTLYDIYERASFFCLTSRWESFGLVLAEAMYFGCEVITTDVGAARDLTQNAELGAVVPIEDVDAYARALSDALTRRDPSEFLRRARLSHQRVRDHFSWASVCRTFFDLITRYRNAQDPS